MSQPTDAVEPSDAMRGMTHLVSDFPTIPYGGETIRIGDLNGDGAPELLVAQCVFGQRNITCLTGVTIHGEILWQVGHPSADNGRVYGDLPVQIYDWDGDGRNEVLYVEQANYAEPILYDDNAYYRDNRICERARRYEGDATMHVLDGRTGQAKASFAIPAPADSGFQFADLTGRGRPMDLVVKDGYWNMWGVSHEGDVLWHWRGSTGHFPAVADVDDDGRDEVFVGCTLIDHDGSVMFDKAWASWKDGEEDAWGVPVHQDAATTVRLADGSMRLLFGNHGVHCMDVQGNVLWENALVFEEAQHVVVGRFSRESEMQVAVIDRGAPRTPEGEPACLYLFDVETGRELWRRPQLPGGWVAACTAIRWSGQCDVAEMLVYNRGTGAPNAVYDGEGDIVAEVPRAPSGYCYHADVWGDGREEVIVVGPDGIRIHANSGPLSVASLYNATLYHGA